MNRTVAATVADIAELGRAADELRALTGTHPWPAIVAGRPMDERVASAAERAAELAARVAGGEFRPAHDGHANRETWTVSLWLGNDEPLYRASTAVARAAFAAPVELGYSAPTGADIIRHRLTAAADALREFVAYRMPDTRFGMAADLLGYAVAVTDWPGIAAGYADADTVCGRCGHTADDHWRPVARDAAADPRRCDECACSAHVQTEWTPGYPAVPAGADMRPAPWPAIYARTVAFVDGALTDETAAPAVLRPWTASLADDAEPTCDICGRRQDDSPAGFADADWNPETGAHETCETAGRTVAS